MNHKQLEMDIASRKVYGGKSIFVKSDRQRGMTADRAMLEHP